MKKKLLIGIISFFSVFALFGCQQNPAPASNPNPSSVVTPTTTTTVQPPAPVAVSTLTPAVKDKDMIGILSFHSNVTLLMKDGSHPILDHDVTLANGIKVVTKDGEKVLVIPDNIKSKGEGDDYSTLYEPELVLSDGTIIDPTVVVLPDGNRIYYANHVLNDGTQVSGGNNVDLPDGTSIFWSGSISKEGEPDQEASELGKVTLKDGTVVTSEKNGKVTHVLRPNKAEITMDGVGENIIITVRLPDGSGFVEGDVTPGNSGVILTQADGTVIKDEIGNDYMNNTVTLPDGTTIDFYNGRFTKPDKTEVSLETAVQ